MRVARKNIPAHLERQEAKRNALHAPSHQGKRYRDRSLMRDKRGQIVGRVDISERPDVVDVRKRFGDLEVDTIVGKDSKGGNTDH